MTNPYEILGLDSDASDEQVKSAYRKLVQTYHPDKESGNQDKFIQIKKAYDSISNKSINKTPFKDIIDGKYLIKYYDWNEQSLTTVGRVIDLYRQYNNCDKLNYFKKKSIIKEIKKELPGNIINEEHLHLSVMSALQSKYLIAYVSLSDLIINSKDFFNNRPGDYFKGKEKIYYPSDTLNEMSLLMFFSNEENGYIRKGVDVYTKVNITLAEAIKGTEIEINYLNGKKYKIEFESTNSISKTLKLTGLGCPYSMGVGNLYIEVNVELPKYDDLTDDQREYILALGYREKITI